MNEKENQRFSQIRLSAFICKALYAIAKMMRVAGEVEFLNDIALKTKLIEERPFLKAIATGGPEDPLLVIFRVYTGEAHFWTRENNMQELEIERIKF